MMKKTSKLWIRAAAFGFVLAAGGAAHAETYGKLETGGTFDGKLRTPGADADLKGGWEYGGALGTNVSPNVRLEGELSQQRSDLKSGGKAPATLALANAYYDFRPDAQVTPFVGGGIGAVKLDPSGPAHDTAFAYKLTGGVATKFSDRITGELAYRYTAANELNLGGVDTKYHDNAITAGVRIKLGQ
jgi:opacity protein-like surface antigen